MSFRTAPQTTHSKIVLLPAFRRILPALETPIYATKSKRYHSMVHRWKISWLELISNLQVRRKMPHLVAFRISTICIQVFLMGYKVIPLLSQVMRTQNINLRNHRTTSILACNKTIKYLRDLRRRQPYRNQITFSCQLLCKKTETTRIRIFRVFKITNQPVSKKHLLTYFVRMTSQCIK